MEKEDYARMQVRKEIVLAFISKSTGIDVSFIPALDKYIQDGDTQFFNDFCNFMLLKSSEERTKMLEEEKAKWEVAKPEIERWIHDFESVKAEWAKFVEEHEGKVEYKSKCGTLVKHIDAFIGDPFERYLTSPF